ncbi:hypothetical protein DLJ53_21230 [Acuticoccus sediminis]|uniref:AB hydrolase-1 domain-containing protein n=1 Tax=Acuticoccus sediminis TaxID=2184697 RepID=A0A8B2NNP2_9HYPH|nr:alpha/beta fold hydrolase [Acuticoccus sediminis]RAI00231.1 hypothetical protein DLJ53_21230 [Acuticoccus sediminis]
MAEHGPYRAAPQRPQVHDVIPDDAPHGLEAIRDAVAHGPGRLLSEWRRRGLPRGGWVGAAAVYGGAALLGAYIFQSRTRSKAETERPPLGRFLDVDDATLHYVDIGSGPPVVLIHSGDATLEDWFISGIAGRLLPNHRLILVDRPGYGYSTRSRSVNWAPERQGRAVAQLLHRLGVRKPTLVAHGTGALPAIAIALQHPAFARALVLIGPVVFPSDGSRGIAARIPGLPVVGPLANATALPSVARAALPARIDAAFEPQPVPPGFMEAFPAGLVTRPRQLEATAQDNAGLDEATVRFSRHYKRLALPLTIVAGSGDGIADPDRQARRLAITAPGARLVVLPAMGHMVHHTAPDRVAAAIIDTAAVKADSTRSTPRGATAPRGDRTPGDVRTEGDERANMTAPPRPEAASTDAAPEPAAASRPDDAGPPAPKTTATRRAGTATPAKRSSTARATGGAKRSPSSKRPPTKRGSPKKTP